MLNFGLGIVPLKGSTASPTPKLSLFCLCSISKSSTHFWKMIYTFYSELSKKLKNIIKLLVGQRLLSYWSKQHFDFFFWYVTFTAWPTKKKVFGLLKFQCHFWVPWTIYYKIHIIFQKSVDNFETEHKTC